VSLLRGDSFLTHLQQQTPTASNVLGVFGLSIRTQERDLDDEFSRFGKVSKVTIVYDQRSDRSRGFGFIEMATTEDATRCIEELNGFVSFFSGVGLLLVLISPSRN
jgi:transformer-2 protein